MNFLVWSNIGETSLSHSEHLIKTSSQGRLW